MDGGGSTLGMECWYPIGERLDRLSWVMLTWAASDCLVFQVYFYLAWELRLDDLSTKARYWRERGRRETQAHDFRAGLDETTTVPVQESDAQY